MERDVELQARRVPGIPVQVARLEGVPGLGHLETLSLLAELVDVERFPGARHLLVYAGIAPRGGTSGVGELGGTVEKVVARDVPNKQCNRYLKRTLVRAATVILRTCTRTTREDDLYEYARALKARPGVKFMKLVFKVAAKLGRVLYHVLACAVAYDGDHEKTAAAAEGAARRSRNSRRRQRYRKAREARLLAERQVEVLLDQLEALGVDPERARAAAAGRLAAGGA